MPHPFRHIQCLLHQGESVPVLHPRHSLVNYPHSQEENVVIQEFLSG